MTTYTKKYLNSFGELTKEQKVIVKNTIRYQRCLLADEFENIKKTVYDEIRKIFIRNKK